MPTIRLFNPRRRSKARRRASKKARRPPRAGRRSNLPEGGTLTFMANRHRKHRRRGSRRRNMRPRGRSHAARRRNPFRVRRSGRRFRRNPFGITGTTLIKRSAYAIAGGIITRTLPAAVLPRLGIADAGITGYVANAAATWVSAYAAGKFINSEAGEAVLLGGVMATVGRIAEEYLKRQFVEFGTYPLQQLSGGRSLRGDFRDYDFVWPPSSALPAARSVVCPPVAAAPARRMSGLWTGPWN